MVPAQPGATNVSNGESRSCSMMSAACSSEGGYVATTGIEVFRIAPPRTNGKPTAV
jgi:hypothetical protein